MQTGTCQEHWRTSPATLDLRSLFSICGARTQQYNQTAKTGSLARIARLFFMSANMRSLLMQNCVRCFHHPRHLCHLPRTPEVKVNGTNPTSGLGKRIHPLPCTSMGILCVFRRQTRRSKPLQSALLLPFYSQLFETDSLYCKRKAEASFPGKIFATIQMV